MAFNLIISDTVRFKVDGSLTEADGKPRNFDFFLTCERLKTTEELRALDVRQRELLGEGHPQPITEVMRPLVKSWDGVNGPDGSPLPFTPENFERLMKVPGVALIAYYAYMSAVGAKQKN